MAARRGSDLAPPPIPADFGFTDDHALAKSAARRFLRERCTTDDVRRLAADPVGFDREAWKQIAELGWIGLVIPEVLGGAGLDRLHLALLLEEMGRVLLPSPFVGSVLAGLALAEAGGPIAERLCPAIASGEAIGTVALDEPGGSWEPDEVAATATPADGGWVLRGAKAHVMYGAAAKVVIVPCREGDSVVLFAVELPSKGVAVEAEVAVDATRPTARMKLDGVRVGPEARLEGDGLAILRAVHASGWSILASEMIGAADAVLERTSDYAKQRQQFGKAIGAFQAVKHPIVDMMVGVEQARGLALAAAAAQEARLPGGADAARMAKAYAGDVLAFAVKKGVQLHGGFGFTWDCDVHFYFKRSLWARGALGDSIHHRRRLAEKLLGATAD